MSKEKDSKVPQSRNVSKRPIEPSLLQPLSDLSKQALLSKTGGKKGKQKAVDAPGIKKARRMVLLGEIERWASKSTILEGFELNGSLDMQNLITDKPVEISVDAKVSPAKLKGILNAFGTYYRACGGDGLAVTAEFDDFPKVK